MKSVPRRLVVFDADDTLWETQSLYDAAKCRFLDEMSRAGFSRAYVGKLFERIDNENVARFGFTKTRFPRSMQDTYRALCSEFGKKFSRVRAKRLRSFGNSVFRSSPRLFDGVTMTLAKLRSHDVRLVLATKGDPEVQRRRVRLSGLRDYFERVYILDHKGVAEFKRIAKSERIHPKLVWSVGNSAKSDINPAIAAGLSAVWIRRKTWVHEEEKISSNPRLYSAKSIREVPKIILGRK